MTQPPTPVPETQADRIKAFDDAMRQGAMQPKGAGAAPTPEELRAKALAAAQPVRLISIAEVTIGELVALYFKLFIAAIPLALTLLALWYMIWIVRSQA